ncbi:nicotinate-nucleotide adenylyltransferase [Desulforegula conservatrix]|uniref:nicotinate-nucleotide adenylyltransferase n=1 Tax=Desulforegula conservatrix TaxID=153026 RepID=UPI0004155A05|nr:nicotinate-nucleotide adenylyltransferase [Desulforegula conservatrix]
MINTQAQTQKWERIGVFGGTFDPVHHGHLRVALEVKDAMSLDRVIFVPANIPPHKSRPDIASASDRMAMVRLACNSVSAFEVSGIELERNGRSYTADTLSLLSINNGGEGELFFIMGMDAFMQFHTWKDPERILGTASLIIMTRPDYDHEAHDVEKYIRQYLSEDYVPSSGEEISFFHPDLCGIFFVKVTGLEISGTTIRELAKKEKSLAFLVPQKVEEYIVSRGLYR